MMVINVETKTLRVYLNGYEWGVLINDIIFDINKKYSLAICCCPLSTHSTSKTMLECIEMMDFITI